MWPWVHRFSTHLNIMVIIKNNQVIVMLAVWWLKWSVTRLTGYSNDVRLTAETMERFNLILAVLSLYWHYNAGALTRQMGLKLGFVPLYCVACKIDEWLKQTLAIKWNICYLTTGPLTFCCVFISPSTGVRRPRAVPGSKERRRAFPGLAEGHLPGEFKATRWLLRLS